MNSVERELTSKLVAEVRFCWRAAVGAGLMIRVFLFNFFLLTVARKSGIFRE